MKCCSSPYIKYDKRLGELVCANCGTVQEQKTRAMSVARGGVRRQKPVMIKPTKKKTKKTREMIWFEKTHKAKKKPAKKKARKKKAA